MIPSMHLNRVAGPHYPIDRFQHPGGAWPGTTPRPPSIEVAAGFHAPCPVRWRRIEPIHPFLRDEFAWVVLVGHIVSTSCGAHSRAWGLVQGARDNPRQGLFVAGVT